MCTTFCPGGKGLILISTSAQIPVISILRTLATFNTKQITTSITLLDECLFAKIKNVHVPTNTLKNKKYKLLTLSAVFSTVEIRSLNVKEGHIRKQNFTDISEPKDTKYTVRQKITSND